MAYGLFLPKRWKRQPQGLVEIDVGHSIGRKVHYAYAPWLSLTTILRGNRAGVSATTLNSPLRLAGRQGVGMRVLRTGGFTGTGVDIVGDGVNLSEDLSFAAGSIFFLIDALEHSGVVEGLLRFASGDSLRIEPTTFYPSLYISSGSRATGTIGVPEGYSGSFTLSSQGNGGGSNLAKCYVGRQLALDADTASFDVKNLTGIRSVTVGYPTWRCPLLLRTDLLTEAETFALDENPWQVLLPRRAIIYSFPSGGITIPTLSLAGVQDITATGARPKATLTF